MTDTPPPARRRRVHGPRTWALAREFYLSGASALEVEARLGVSPHALRRRAGLEGWTRAALAAREVAFIAPTSPAAPAAPPCAAAGRAADPATPLNPEALAQVVTRRAIAALAAGRPAEAMALARAYEPVAALMEGLALPPQDEDPDGEIHRAELVAQLEREWRTAVRLAEALLKDGHVPAIHTRAALRWRADKLGPDVAATDRAAVEHATPGRPHYDEAGCLLPPISFEDFLEGRR